jgi:hypothetical protein
MVSRQRASRGDASGRDKLAGERGMKILSQEDIMCRAPKHPEETAVSLQRSAIGFCQTNWVGEARCWFPILGVAYAPLLSIEAN